MSETPPILSEINPAQPANPDSKRNDGLYWPKIDELTDWRNNELNSLALWKGVQYAQLDGVGMADEPEIPEAHIAAPEVQLEPTADSPRLRPFDYISGRASVVRMRAEKIDRRLLRSQLSPDELEARRKKQHILKAIALLGIVVVGVQTARHGLPAFVIPPSAAGRTRNLSSANVAGSGSVIDPNRQEHFFRRASNILRGWRGRRNKNRRISGYLESNDD